MSSNPRTEVQSWVVVGLVFAVVLAAESYQARGAAGRVDGAGIEAHVLTFLGGSRRAVPSGMFRGGEVTTVMGRTELDLRAAIIQPGEEMVVEVVTVMGGLTIRVPDGWTVDARAVPVLGRVRDSRLRPFESLDEPLRGDPGPAPRLVVRGAVVMGALVIKS